LATPGDGSRDGARGDLMIIYDKPLAITWAVFLVEILEKGAVYE